MKRWLASTALLCSLAFIGCGQADQGPADASATPQVSEEEVEKSMMEGMPEEMKKKYGK